MSGRKRTDVSLLVISIVSFLLMSVSFLIMPFGNDANGKTSLITYVSGGMFWTFLVLGIVFQAILSKRRKDWYIYYHIKQKTRVVRVKKGIFSFFKNVYGTVSDILFVLSLIGLIITTAFFDDGMYVCYVLVSFIVFAFCMHCIFNGKIFYYVDNQDELLKAIEDEHNNYL